MVFEYGGKGVRVFDRSERPRSPYGRECGVTIHFPSDKITPFSCAHSKEERDFTELKADKEAIYARIINIDLSKSNR